MVPDHGPGYAELADGAAGRGAQEIARAAADGEITALYLFETDPVRDHPDRALWESALRSAGPRRRPRLGPDRRPARARQRHLPGRVARREGGHGRSPRRAPPAAAHRDRPSRAGPRRLVGDRRDRDAMRSRPRCADRRHGVEAARDRGPVLRRPDARGDRRPRRALARARAGQGPRRRRRRPGRAHRIAACSGRLGGRRPAARHLPADLGRARGRDLSGAALRDRRAAGRALARGRRPPRDQQRRRGRRGPAG